MNQQINKQMNKQIDKLKILSIIIIAFITLTGLFVNFDWN